MAEFVSGKFEIYTHTEDNRDDPSPLGSRSPNRKQGVASSQRNNLGRIAKIGVAAMAVKQIGTTVIQEISASQGNERMMKDIGNATTTVAFGVLAVKAPPLAAAYAAYQGVQTAVNYREMQRENADRRMQRELMGARTSNNRGGFN